MRHTSGTPKEGTRGEPEEEEESERKRKKRGPAVSSQAGSRREKKEKDLKDAPFMLGTGEKRSVQKCPGAKKHIQTAFPVTARWYSQTGTRP